MWERYSRGVDVIVWVVDSADVDGLAVGRGDMTSLLSHRYVVVSTQAVSMYSGGLHPWMSVHALSLPFPPSLSLFNESSLRQIPLLIVGNKSDLPAAASTSALRERFVPTDTDDSRETDVISTSCLTGDGINEVITWLGTRAH